MKRFATWSSALNDVRAGERGAMTAALRILKHPRNSNERTRMLAELHRVTRVRALKLLALCED